MRKNLTKKGWLYYDSLFPAKRYNGDLTGEASALYFWSKVCAPRIAEYCPKAKLILILRNPVKRAMSHYYAVNNETTPEWRKRHKSYWYDLTFEEAIKQSKWADEIINQGYYFEHLQRWLKFFPREQIHITILEDLAMNPECEVNKIFNFLGLNDFKLDSYAPENKGSYRTGSITPESIKMLEQIYELHNKKLEKFLGRSLPWSFRTTKTILNDAPFV